MRRKPKKTRAALRRAARRHEDKAPAPPPAPQDPDAQAAADVESSLLGKALDGNVTAQVFWLCNRAPRRWRSTSRVPLPPPGAPVSFADFMRTALLNEESQENAESHPD